jgi:hypothetical protein
MFLGDNRYCFETIVRFELARQYPELLAKLDEQIEEENREHIKVIAKRHGVQIKFVEPMR